MKAIARLLTAMILSVPIAYAEQQAVPDMYKKMTTFNAAKTFAVRNLSLTRSGATLDFESGEITLIEALNGRYHAALFTGRGVFRFRPPDGIERDQLHKFTGTRVLEEPFHSVLLRFSDQTADEIMKTGNESANKNITCNKCKEITHLILKRY